jgi:hypothetical protein
MWELDLGLYAQFRLCKLGLTRPGPLQEVLTCWQAAGLLAA